MLVGTVAVWLFEPMKCRNIVVSLRVFLQSRWDCRCHRICFDTELNMVLMPHQRNVLLAVTTSKYELTWLFAGQTSINGKSPNFTWRMWAAQRPKDSPWDDGRWIKVTLQLGNALLLPALGEAAFCEGLQVFENLERGMTVAICVLSTM